MFHEFQIHGLNTRPVDIDQIDTVLSQCPIRNVEKSEKMNWKQHKNIKQVCMRISMGKKDIAYDMLTKQCL